MIEMSVSDAESEYVLELNGNVDVRVAAELQVAILEALSKDKPLTIDCSSIDSFDASFLQLLLATKRASHRPLTVKTGDGQALKWFELSGLKSELIGA